MRQTVSITLVAALAAFSNVNGELMEFEGCLNGTSLETKFPEAFESCEIDGNDHWEFDIIHQEAADDCDFASLRNAFLEQANDGVCLMNKLGWINEDHSMNQAAVSMDMATLDAKVMNGISQYEIQMCLRSHAEELKELLGDDCHLKPREIKVLLAINKKIADYKCLLQAFGRSCVMNSGMYEQPEGSNDFDGFGNDGEVPDLDDGSFEGSMEGSMGGSMEGPMSGSMESMEGSMEGPMSGSMESMEGLMDGSMESMEGFMSIEESMEESMSLEELLESSEEDSDVPDLDDGSFDESEEESEEDSDVPDLDDGSFDESEEESEEGSEKSSEEESEEESMESSEESSEESSMESSEESSMESSEESSMESSEEGSDESSEEESEEGSEESSEEESDESSEEVPDIDDERFMLNMA